MKRGAVLLAGGVGSRFGSEKPKQFHLLDGRPVLDYSLGVFLNEVDVFCVVCHPHWKKELFSLPHWNERIFVADGGKTRQQSVFSGLSLLQREGVDVVAIHDGARPLISQELLSRGWEKLKQSLCAIPVVPIVQTIAYVSEEKITYYGDRTHLVIIQTPQFFHFEVIWEAHKKALSCGISDASDDSQLLQKQGFPVDIIKGESWNIKITTLEDMFLAQAYLREGVII